MSGGGPSNLVVQIESIVSKSLRGGLVGNVDGLNRTRLHGRCKLRHGNLKCPIRRMKNGVIARRANSWPIAIGANEKDQREPSSTQSTTTKQSRSDAISPTAARGKAHAGRQRSEPGQRENRSNARHQGDTDEHEQHAATDQEARERRTSGHLDSPSSGSD